MYLFILRYKIPVVPIPDIEVLKRCMTSLPSHQLSAQVKTSSKNTTSVAARLKLTEQDEMFPPASLKSIKSQQQYQRLHVKKTVSLSSLASHTADKQVDQPKDQSNSDSCSVSSSQTKPWVLNFKSKLKNAMGNSAMLDDSNLQSKVQSYNKLSNDSQKVAAENSGLIFVKDSVAEETRSSDGESSDNSCVLKHVPALCYGKRKRVLSSDSMTESDCESPLRLSARRAQRVIDSDESEIEDSNQRKKRQSKRRRIAGWYMQ